MDAKREQMPAPEAMRDLPEHVRKWLNSLEPEDIELFRKWKGFIVWLETSGRYTQKTVLYLASTLGVISTALYIWGQWMGKR